MQKKVKQKSLKELLKKEDKLREDREFYHFDLDHRDYHNSGDDLIKCENKLEKVRKQILVALQKELDIRSKW